MPAQNGFSEICKLMEAYFKGLHHADTARLAKVFHPDARYINMTEGDYINKPLGEYFAIVEKRTPPAKTGEKRKDNIISIELGGENMAFVKASMTMMQRDYLDFLTLTLDHHGWQIMSKIFTYTPTENSIKKEY